MAISDWPLAERPRERLLAEGAKVLSDAELVAVLLRTGLPGKSAVELGRELVHEFNGVSGVLEAGARRGAGTRASRAPGGAQKNFGADFAGSGARLSPARHRWARARSVRLHLARRPAPRDQVRGAVPGHADADERVSPGDRQGGARLQRGRGDLCP